VHHATRAGKSLADARALDAAKLHFGPGFSPRMAMAQGKKKASLQLRIMEPVRDVAIRRTGGGLFIRGGDSFFLTSRRLEAGR